jgi:CO/xanthine dehydrogenase FAD-binding subunit
MMADFDLTVCKTMAQALRTLAEHEDAMPVAGATDFIPLVRAGRWRTAHAVEISRLDELRYVRATDGGLEIGALTTHAELRRSPLILASAPVLAEAAGQIAGPQVQARATVGGNVCTASPAADTVPALLVLDAQVVLVSLAGVRRLPLSGFLTGPGQTARRSGELLQSLYIPSLPAGAGAAFEKVGKRKALIISVVNAAALLIAESGRIQEARLALGAVAPTVVRCPSAESLLVGQVPDGSLFARAAELVQGAISPIDDLRASAAYRRLAAEGIARRALARAWERCAR